MYWLVALSILIHCGLAFEFLLPPVMKKAPPTRNLSYLRDWARPVISRVAGLLPARILSADLQRQLARKLTPYWTVVKRYSDQYEKHFKIVVGWLATLGYRSGAIASKIRADRMALAFVCLFAFRYLHLIVHTLAFWLFYRAAPIPKNPAFHTSDCTVILPTVDPNNPDFEECITSLLKNKPGAIVIVTVGQRLAQVTKAIVDPILQHFPRTTVSIATTNVGNKRLQITQGLKHVHTKITVLADDRAFWVSRQFLPALLAPFEDSKVGTVGTRQRVRRTARGFGLDSFWNMLEAVYVERRDFETHATNAIDGGVSLISGQTSAHRSEILKDPNFIDGFTDERFFFGLFGPLEADDDNFITRWSVRHGWKIKLQYAKDALVETSSHVYLGFLSTCLGQARATWRSNTASLFTDRSVWYSQPWCLYAVYGTSFFDLALFYDAALGYTLFTSTFGNRPNLCYLAGWIFFTKLIEVAPHFLRRPRDLSMLLGYVIFTYFHSLVKIYAALTFWKTEWGGGRDPDDTNKPEPPRVERNTDTDTRNKTTGRFVLASPPKPVKREPTLRHEPAPAPASSSRIPRGPPAPSAPAPAPAQPRRRGRPRKTPLPATSERIYQSIETTPLTSSQKSRGRRKRVS